MLCCRGCAQDLQYTSKINPHPVKGKSEAACCMVTFADNLYNYGYTDRGRIIMLQSDTVAQFPPDVLNLGTACWQ